MKFSLHPQALKGWKGRIAESLVEHYIKNVLIPALKARKWNEVFYTYSFVSKVPFKVRETWYRGWKQTFWKQELKLLIAMGFFPTLNFLERFETFTHLLSNIPDGFLIKLKKTGKFKSLKDALVEFKLGSDDWNYAGYSFTYSKHTKRQLPIVNGDVEVVEIKADKSFLSSHQLASYTNVIKNGYALRYFHVDIISLKRNQFEIEEKLITDSNNLGSLRRIAS